MIEDDIKHDSKFIDFREKPNNKIRVAICLSGEMRNWELCKHTYNDFHNYTSLKNEKTKEVYEVEYDFFISLWNCVEMDDVQNDLKNVIAVEFTEPTSNWPVYKNTNNSRFTYLNHRCNLLKTQYEHDNDFVYDFVIQTRPDAVQHTDIFKSLVTLYRKKQTNYMTDFNHYHIYFSKTHGGEPKPNREVFKSDDVFALGNSNSIDAYSLLYKYIFLNPNYNFYQKTHLINPDFIRYLNLHTSEHMVNLYNTVIRESAIEEFLITFYNVGVNVFRDNIHQIKSQMYYSRSFQTTLSANVVIPMAGNGFRFREKGYTDSKPFIQVFDKPMVHRVIRNLTCAYDVNFKFILICLRDDYEKYNFDNFKYVVGHNNIEIVVLDKITDGAAQTILSAKKFIDNEEPLWMMNCDQLIISQPHIQLPTIGVSIDGKGKDKIEDIDGGMLCFKGSGNDWSYAKVGKDGYVEEVAEKKQISNDATAGYYYWSKGSDFVKYAKQMIEENDRTNGEFYLAPVYNWAIRDGKKFKISHVPKVYELGTPEYLDEFKKGSGSFYSGKAVAPLVKIWTEISNRYRKENFQ